MRARLARQRAIRSAATGQPTSHSRTRTTMTLALMARSTERRPVRPLPAARRAREEDHARRIPRNLVEARHHLRLATAACRRVRDRRPHPRLELGTEGLDEILVLLGNLDVPLCDEDLAVTGLHA